MKSYLKNHVRKLRIIKRIIAVLLGIMVAIDVVLVMMIDDGFPTFSWVVRDNRTTLIWFTLLYGGLVSKIFYNRKVDLKRSEWSGFLAFGLVLVLLYWLGQMIEGNVGTYLELFLLVCGGYLAYRVWPQYS